MKRKKGKLNKTAGTTGFVK